MLARSDIAAGIVLVPRPRDPRLDFFRGIGMFIILIAHTPWNSWTDWIPARFGFSDAADMFVFCSGMASSLAFARVFLERGWWMGTARIAHRVWQVYWAHIGSFFVVISVLVAADHYFAVDHYVREELNLQSFFDEPRLHLLGLMTLTYVPNYFDILPMYLAILAMIPIVMGLARVRLALVVVFVLSLWLAANFEMIDLEADPWNRRGWFFNPFGWQLVFFTGFALVRGWLPTPPRDRRLVWLCIAIVLLAAPVSCQQGFGCYAGFDTLPVLGRIHEALAFWTDKMNYGPLRYLHFMATAYLAWMASGVGGANLTGMLVDMTRRVGQQTLAVFLTGLVMAQVLGMALDRLGRDFWTVTLINIVGCAILVAAAYMVHWFKQGPWKGARGTGGAE